MNNWFKAAAVLGLMTCSSGIWAQGRLPVIQQTSFRKDSIYITKFGAIADGQTLNTKAINPITAAALNQLFITRCLLQ